MNVNRIISAKTVGNCCSPIFRCSMAILVLLPAGKLFGQQQPYQYTVEVTYEIVSHPDSNEINTVENESATLLLGKAQSMFCTSKYLALDSNIFSESNKGNSLGPSMGFVQSNSTRNKLAVFKVADQLITYDQAALFVPVINMYYESRDAIKCVINSDTARIGGLACQKAETFYGNRKWIARFTADVPVSDGLYKFCGLPGLILKVSDEQGYWSFNVISLKNINTSLTVHFFNKIPQAMKSKETFFAQKKYSLDHRFELEKLSGTKFSNEAALQQFFVETAKKDNNWIELYKGEGK